LIASQNSRTFSDQRFEISEKKERTMALNDVLHLVEKMSQSRLENQVWKTKIQKFFNFNKNFPFFFLSPIVSNES